MGLLGTIMGHPEEVFPMVKLKMAGARISKQIPAEEH
jgi:farnesyl-diphosphate farnesyltransferase